MAVTHELAGEFDVCSGDDDAAIEEMIAQEIGQQVPEGLEMDYDCLTWDRINDHRVWWQARVTAWREDNPW